MTDENVESADQRRLRIVQVAFDTLQEQRKKLMDMQVKSELDMKYIDSACVDLQLEKQKLLDNGVRPFDPNPRAESGTDPHQETGGGVNHG